MRILLLVLFTLFSSLAFGQQNSPPQVVQFSGLVVTGDSLMPVPFTAVYRQRVKRGTSTDYSGFFSMPVMTGDTIVFSNIGFQTEYHVIPDSVDDKSISMIKILSRDTLELPTTYIFPWPARERFRDAFLALQLEDDEAELGRKNLASVMMYDRMVEMGADGSENFKIAMKQQADKLYTTGQLPQQNIFSPIAWAQFLKSLKDGSLKRQ